MTSHPLPTLPDDAWTLIAGIGTVLIVASLLGQVLKFTVARRQAHAAIDNLNSRIHAWWAMAILFGLAMCAGRSGVALLFGLASLAALHEFLAGETPGMIPQTLQVGSFVFVVPLQYLLVWNGSDALYGSFIPCLVLIGLPLLVALCAANGGDCRRHVRTLQGGLLICVFSVSHIPALLNLPISGHPDRNGYLLVFLLLVVQSSDVLQYLWGKLAGRHAIAPRLSPAKTVEGTVGGIVTASILGIWLAPMTPFTVPEAALISLLLTLLGFLGGLAMSAIKRRRGIKDWGSLLPGHGGMLDRLDSLCLSAPAFYYLLQFGWAS